MAFGLGKGVITLAVSGADVVRNAISSLVGSLGSIGALAGVGSVGAFFGKAIAEASEGQSALAKFNQALIATGGISGVTTAEVDAIASSLQRTAGFADDVTIGAAAMMTQFRNVRGDQFKQVLRISADVAARLGGDVPSAAEQLARALNDPLTGMRQLRAYGVTFDAQQRQQIQTMLQSGDVIGVQNMMLERLSGTFAGAAETMGQTFGGQMSRLWEAINSVAEGVGNSLLPHVQKVTEFIISSVVPNIGAWIETLTDVGGTVWNWLVPILIWLKDTVVSAFTIARDYVRGWGDAIKRAIYESIATFYELVDSTTWAFGVSIPRVLEWFCDNWYSLFLDAVNAVGTVFENLWNNVKSFFSNLWNYITSWGESDFSFVWTPLLDGFESVTEEMPDLWEGFEFGPQAKKWRDKVESIGKDFPQAVADGIAAAPDVVGNAVKGAAKKYTVNVGRVSVEGGSVVGIADVAQNLQVAAMKMRTPAELLAEQQLAESQGQTGIMEEMAAGIGQTNALLSDMTSGARLG